jgi:hypothetical protein
MLILLEKISVAFQLLKKKTLISIKDIFLSLLFISCHFSSIRVIRYTFTNRRLEKKNWNWNIYIFSENRLKQSNKIHRLIFKLSFQSKSFWHEWRFANPNWFLGWRIQLLFTLPNIWFLSFWSTIDWIKQKFQTIIFKWIIFHKPTF